MINKKFFILLKTMIKNELRGQFVKFGKRSTYTQYVIYFTYILWGFLFSLAYFLKPISTYPTAIFKIFSFQFIIVFFLLILELNRTLLYPDDIMVLLQLPVKNENILFGKFYTTIFFSLFYSLLFSFTWLFWGFRSGFSSGIIHFFLLLFFTISNTMLIVILGLFFYLLIYSIIGVKYIKRFFVFFTIFITLLLYFFIFSSNTQIQTTHLSHFTYLPSYYFYLIYDYFIKGNILYVLFYIGIIIVLILLLTIIVLKIFANFYYNFLKHITEKEAIKVKLKKISKNPMKILLFNYFKRDNEFLLKTFNSFIFYIVFIVIVIFNKTGKNNVNFTDTTSIMGIIIYITLYVIFLSMLNIQYSKEWNAAYIYKIVPRRRGEIILSSIDIIFHYFMLLPIIISSIIVALKIDYNTSIFFFLLSYLLGNNLLYLFNLIIPNLPLSKKYDTKKSGGRALVYFILLFPYMAIGIATYYFYYAKSFVFVIILLMILILDIIFRDLLKRKY